MTLILAIPSTREQNVPADTLAVDFTKRGWSSSFSIDKSGDTDIFARLGVPYGLGKGVMIGAPFTHKESYAADGQAQQAESYGQIQDEDSDKGIHGR
jgi:hypothetical protein